MPVIPALRMVRRGGICELEAKTTEGDSISKNQITDKPKRKIKKKSKS